MAGKNVGMEFLPRKGWGDGFSGKLHCRRIRPFRFAAAYTHRSRWPYSPSLPEAK